MVTFAILGVLAGVSSQSFACEACNNAAPDLIQRFKTGFANQNAPKFYTPDTTAKEPTEIVRTVGRPWEAPTEVESLGKTYAEDHSAGLFSQKHKKKKRGLFSPFQR